MNTDGGKTLNRRERRLAAKNTKNTEEEKTGNKKRMRVSHG